MTRRRGYAGIATVVLAALFALSAGAGSQSVTIYVGHMWDQARWEIQQEFDLWFMEQYPHIRVVSENLAWTPEAWVVRAAAGTLPDVIYTLGGWAGGLIENGVFIDLWPYIEATPDFDLEDFYLRGFAKYQRDGAIYAIPYAWDPFLPFINVDLFRERGLAEPGTDWTYDDFLAAAQRLSFDLNGDNFNDIWGVNFPPLGWNTDALLLRPFGVRLVKDDEIRLAFDEPATRDAMTWWIDLVTLHAVSPPVGAAIDASFENGRIAMAWNGSWAIPHLSRALAFSWDGAAVPAGPAGRFTAAESSGYGITAQSRNPDAAWIYLNAYMSTEGQLLMWGTSYEQLSRRSAAVQALDLPGAPPNYREFYRALEYYALDAPANPALTEVYGIIGSEIGQVLAGVRSPAAAFEAIQTLGNAALARVSE